VAVYFVAAKIGLLFAAISPSASAVWPPSGIAFAACLVLGLRVWPAIFLGAFLANATTTGSVATSLGIAAGNTLEAVVAASLIIRLAHGVRVFETVRGIFAFVALAALGSPTISATIGVASLLLGGHLIGADAGGIWLTWWLGDATGNLIIAPLLVLWATNPSIAWSRDRVPEAVAVLGSLVLLGVVAFGRSLPAGNFPLSFLCIPPLLWAAFRFGARATATATVLMSAMAVWGHARTIGSLSPQQANTALVLLQVFMATISITALTVAVLVWERRRADHARARLAAIVESSADAIISTTVDGLITSWNRAAEQLYGWSPAEAIGRPIMLIVPEDRRAEEDEILSRARRGEPIDSVETVRVAKDGRSIDLFLTVSPVRDSTGRIVGVSKIASDIGERKRADAERARLLLVALRAQEQLRTVVESMSAAVTQCSRDCRYVWVSKPYADWLGLKVEEIVGRPIADVLGAEAFAAIRPHIDRVLAGERVVYEEQVAFRGPGLRWVHAVYTPVFGAGPTPDGWVAVVMDIDDRHRMEDAVKAALASADTARRQAEAGAQARDQFLAMLGHELRNPLGAIVSAVSVLRLPELTEPLAERARDVLDRQTHQLRRLVDELLDVARVLTGKVTLNRSPVDLGNLVRLSVAAWQSAGRVPQHELELDVASVWVMADAFRLEQVVSNLLDNALKYTPNGGRVRVSVRASGDTAVLEIADTGIGMSADLIDRVFDPFVQGERTLDRSQGGLGLGLTLVKSIVEGHGGEITARSDGAGRGSVFLVRVPRILAPTSGDFPAPRAATSTGHRILIVEDNADAASMLSTLLTLAGHEVTEAPDGMTGVDIATHAMPEVALIDVGLPDIDGYEVARRIRAHPDGKSIMLIAVTGHGQTEDRQRALDAGFDAHLTKPVSLDQLAPLLK
jgi:PAS domain S-box-containing protein